MPALFLRGNQTDARQDWDQQNPQQRTRFWYGSDGSRYQRIDEAAGVASKRTLYVGNLEIVSQGGVTRTRRYIAGVAVEEWAGSAGMPRFMLHDHLGSVVALVDANAQIVEAMDYGAFGERRGNIATGGDPVVSQFTARGFTGHEMVDGTDIVHMNGRIYDSRLGRFLQADPFVQEPNNPQNFNRYTYVLNNPLSLTDPSGFLFGGIGKFFKRYFRPLAAIAITIYLTPALTAALGELGAAITSGFVSGLVSSGSLKGGVFGAFSAAAFFGVGSAIEKFGTGGDFLGSGLSRGTFGAKVLSHGITGGVMSELQGGKFGHGFAAAGVMAAFSGAIDRLDQGTAGISAERVFVAAALGGTASALSGGKFANGAITGAFSRAFNDEVSAHRSQRQQELAERAEARANAALRKAGLLNKVFVTDETGSAIDKAAIAFSDVVQPIANEIGVEIASQLTDVGDLSGKKILLSMAVSDGLPDRVTPSLAPDTGGVPIGFVHTHPDVGLLSGPDIASAYYYLGGPNRVHVAYAVVSTSEGVIAKWNTQTQRQEFVRFRGEKFF